MGRKLCYLIVLPALAASCWGREPADLRYQSAFLRVELAADQPAFVALAVDSLGGGRLEANPLWPLAPSATRYIAKRTRTRVEYRMASAPGGSPPAWSFEFSAKSVHLASNYSAADPPNSLLLNFNLNIYRATLLGIMNPDHTTRLPALLHTPLQGTFRITAASGGGLPLGYDAFRHPIGQRDKDFLKVSFPAASPSRPHVEYTLDVVDIHPDAPATEGDSRFDAFRRGWLNVFQVNPRFGVLANSSNGGPCPFCGHEFSAVALRTPPLAPGLTAMDLVRQYLELALKDVHAFTPGDPSFDIPFFDTYPSLLITAADYVRGTQDGAWLSQHYATINGWARNLLASDKDNDGVFEYYASGNSGSWGPWGTQHPANWWDSIGFGNKDAYSNALAYHGLLGMAELARRQGHSEDAALYTARAARLKAVYYPTFFNPETGVLAGWRSLDGKLHDDYFTFVAGAAITYDLVSEPQANSIMDHLLAKMKEVGYTQFRYGLPGNLIPVPAEDFLDPRQVWGGGGKWGFEWYENGGATADMVYYTLEALYKLGRKQEADAILFPMLKSYEDGTFQGTSTYKVDGRTRTFDWRRWDGEPAGYEGILTDGYMALLAILSR